MHWLQLRQNSTLNECKRRHEQTGCVHAAAVFCAHGQMVLKLLLTGALLIYVIACCSYEWSVPETCETTRETAAGCVVLFLAVITNLAAI